MRVLILTSSTGGGHDMRASAFAEWAQRAGVKTQLHRPLETSHPLYRFGVGLYNWIQRRAPILHHAYFNFLEVAAPCRSTGRLLGAEKFRDALRQFRPGVVLSVHGSLNHAYFELAREAGARCVTYSGELSGGYGFSRNWVNSRADLFLGAVEGTCAAARRHGMPAEKTKVGGFLLRPEFYENGARKEPEEFTLLLSASRRGANNHLAFLKALAPQIRVVVLCGNSQDTRERVESWRRENPQRSVTIAPSESNMAQLLSRVSAVVARPGTGITSEAILSECPLIFNCLGGAMPQEMITLQYCREHQLARTIRSPNEFAQIAAAWKNDDTALAAIREKMRTLRPPQHPREIVAAVAALA